MTTDIYTERERIKNSNKFINKIKLEGKKKEILSNRMQKKSRYGHFWIFRLQMLLPLPCFLAVSTFLKNVLNM